MDKGGLGWAKLNLGPLGEFMPLEVPKGGFSYCFLPWKCVYGMGVEETKGRYQ